MKQLGSLVIIFTILLSCNKFLSEPQKVKQVIRKGVIAIQTENLFILQQIIAENYQDNWGHDYPCLIKWFEDYFQRYDNIQLRIISQKVSIQEHRAVAEIQIRICSTEICQNELFGEDILLTLILEKSNQVWKITRAFEM